MAGMLAGMAAGVVTGLLPGLHPNSVIFLVLPVYFSTGVEPMTFVGVATGMSIVHTFVSFVPSVFVGAPDAGTALSVLPGHRYLQEGRGVEAVELTVYGGLISSVISFASLPLLAVAVPIVYGFLEEVMHLVLLGILGLMLARDRNRVEAAAITGLSGFIGVLVLGSPVANTQYVLFPMFAGFFGVSVIAIALLQGSGVPEQGGSLRTSFGLSLKGGVLGYIAGLVSGFLPGLGASQSALLLKESVGAGRRDFLVAMGGITTADLFLSLAAMYVIGKPRSGAAVAMQQVMEWVGMRELVLVVGMAMVSVGAGAVVARRAAVSASDFLEGVDYRRMLHGVLGFIALGSYLLNGWFGLLVLITASATGVLAALKGVRRSYCMASLIIPTVLYHAPL